MEKSNYKIFAAANGKPAKLVLEFHAPNPSAAKEKLEELQKDLQYLHTYLFLHPQAKTE